MRFSYLQLIFGPASFFTTFVLNNTVMNTIFRIKISAVIAMFILGAMPALGQTIRKAEWSCIKMDSTYDGKKVKSTKVIEQHKATSPGLLKPIGKCEKELKSDDLQRFVSDAMFTYASQTLARKTKDPNAKADVAIIKFKSRKVSLPEGDVSANDIISLFPVDNKILIFDLKGEHLKQLIRKASRKGSVSSIKEKDVENDRIYKVITMDYMLRKEVCADVLEYSENLVESSILYLSNTLVQHVRRLAQKGETIK
jgi:hypothetical protein